MRILRLFRLYTFPWLCVFVLSVGYSIGMLYFYEPLEYQKILKRFRLDVFHPQAITHQAPKQDITHSVLSYRVLANILNIRAEPRVDSDIVGRLHRGEKILITEVEKSWGSLVDGDLKVRGYVFLGPTNVLKIDAQSPLDTYFVNIRALNVRKEPIIADNVIKKIYASEVVWLLEDLGDGWGKVEIDGVEGYVSMQWLKKIE